MRLPYVSTNGHLVMRTCVLFAVNVVARTLTRSYVHNPSIKAIQSYALARRCFRTIDGTGTRCCVLMMKDRLI
ncbi:hypothetical protein DFH94DRAFT_744772 [Russula ochroleuca]|uniref:Uncharacterized protein n=1 Tax=Russula ochroleuca TaxID=152965 RepID=A0A9P5MVH6_9AGAM|nr:hypothetical protein DFH94DRAFT_744772 [Russula ochroleuca]